MNRILSLAVLAAGIVLIVYGVAASDSFSSEISKAFTGSPTDRTIWLLAGGAALAVVGGYGLSAGRSK